MSNDDPTTPEDEEPRPPREPTEGVRILGAQEASEATGRHEVVRRGRVKRFGDRPDSPEAESDLPRITISSTEEPPAAGAGDRFGAVPVVPPGGTEAGSASGPPEPGAGEPASGEPAVDEPVPEEPAAEEPAGLARPAPEAPVVEDLAEVEPVVRRGRRSAAEPVAEPVAEEPVAEKPIAEEPVAEEPIFEEPIFEEPEAVGVEEEDDTFVLPHWTEPATGQVPKVVADAEDEPPGSSDHGPRWRDEDDDDGRSGFEDLTDDAPLLGALSGSQSGREDLEDDEIPLFDDEVDRDPLEAFGPPGEDEELDRPPRRRRESPTARRRRPGGGGGGGEGPPASGSGDRNLPVAVGVGVGLVAVGLLCFWLGTIATMLLATVVVVVAGLEYFTAVRDVGYNPATLLGLVALGAMVVGPALFGLAAYPVVLGITVLAGLVWFLAVAPGEGSVPNLGITLLGIMWIGFLASFAGLFLGLGDVVQDRNDWSSNPGIGVLIAAVIVAVSYDIGGYFVGRRFGRTPLSEASPNKTQEGLGGGIVSAVVVTTILVSFIQPVGDGIFRTFVFALLCALAAPVGDLSESFVKRDLGIKDMGSVLPAHGGVLDRFDSMLFVLPVAYFVSLPLGIWSA